MNYQYWSLKQLESDVLDLASGVHKLNIPGAEVKALNLNLSEPDFNKFYTDLMEKTSPEGSTFAMPEKGTMVKFNDIDIYVTKATEEECQVPTQTKQEN